MPDLETTVDGQHVDEVAGLPVEYSAQIEVIVMQKLSFRAAEPPFNQADARERLVTSLDVMEFSRRFGDKSGLSIIQSAFGGFTMSCPASILFLAAVFCLTVFTLGGPVKADEKPAVAEKAEAKANRFFELRTYHAAEGKLEALHARFRDHTNVLFKKHGMTIIAFWTPADEPASKNTLIYVLAYPDREAREKAWKDFQSDPEWQAAKAESEKDGTLVSKVDSVFMNPTDYSPIR